MAQAVGEAERERELTKQALASDIDRLEARIRAELDWKARLRREGVKVAIVGGVVLVAAVGIVVLRRQFSHEDAAPQRSPSTLDEMALELGEIRKQLDRAKIEPDADPLWQKVAMRAVAAAAGAAGTYAARRFMARTEQQPAGSGATG